MARTVIDRIVETGDLRRGRLGISFEDATPALVRDFKLAAMPVAPVVTRVEAGSPAELAGLKAGDVVTDLGGTPVRDTSHLRARLGLLWVGDTAELTVMRGGKPAVIRATIADPQRARAGK
jgi:serine protease Do/serine protease DegQ